MLIKIEKANSNIGCNVILDSWRIRFRNYGEAIAFVERLTERVNAHTHCRKFSARMQYCHQADLGQVHVGNRHVAYTGHCQSSSLLA